MLTIDRLNLRLPAGYQGRADRIARMVAGELEGSLGSEDRRIERLTVPPITSAPGVGDRELARKIARSITHSINASSPGAMRDGGDR